MASDESSDAISPIEDKKFDPKFDEKAFAPVEEIETTNVQEELTNEVIVSKVIDSNDNSELNPWTFRSVFLGIGLAIFGAVLAEIYYFKPQTILVNGIFLLMIAYVLGEAMSNLIPRHTSRPGLTWLNPALKFLNPQPFNIKEHVVILTMSSTASTAALATEVLAVQKLWYTNSAPVGKAIGIFTIFTSQILGYGVIGVLRKTLVYPTKMFYPNILPQVSTLQALHNDRSNNKGRLKLFYICFGCMFIWEIVPEWMFQLLIGFSIPCLAASHSSVVSNIFGGTNGNEGLGLLSICFDWNYIAGTGNPMAVPIVATMNNLVGYFLCIAVFLGVYYGNVWEAQKFPFLSQSLYTAESEKGNYVLFNQSQILDSQNSLDVAALERVGVPYMTPTYTVYLIATNLSIAATFTHMYLYHWDILKQALGFLDPRTWKDAVSVIKSVNLKFWQKGEHDGRLNRDGSIPELCDDPHFRAMLKYKEVPHWWYICALILSFAVALVCLYVSKSGLPWWALIVAMILAALFTTVLGGLVGMFGFGGTQMQTVIQMIGSYIHPGNPVANMYFTLYGYNSVQQAFLMLADLKQAQYIKLAPRSLFVAQFIGTVVGSIFNYVMMESIVTNQKDILLSIEGTAIWSGQNIQQYNTQGVSWGALAKYMYSVGSRYEWVPLALLVGFACPIPFYIAHRVWPKAGFQNINVPILVWYIGWLCVGVNASITSYFIVAFVSQWYLRKYYPEWFKKYNYIVAAGLTGGAQVMVFVLSFAVAGASGASHDFPSWWGNSLGENFDHCYYNN